MPPTRKVVHEIPLHPESPPQFRRIFQLSPVELQELQKQLDGLLKDEEVSPSTSPYGASTSSRHSRQWRVLGLVSRNPPTVEMGDIK